MYDKDSALMSLNLCLPVTVLFQLEIKHKDGVQFLMLLLHSCVLFFDSKNSMWFIIFTDCQYFLPLPELVRSSHPPALPRVVWDSAISATKLDCFHSCFKMKQTSLLLKPLPESGTLSVEIYI
jgi:hypothetical protein